MNAPDSDRTRPRLVAILAVAGLLIGVLVAVYLQTAATRNALRTYTALISAANRGDLEAIRGLCSARYLAENPPRLAPEGGLIGLPRGIHKNFAVWREGDHVLLRPTDRVGPVYRFVDEAGAWRFDGLAGYFNPDGRFIPADAGVDRT